MKILCSISGLEFQVPYFPATLQSRESHHPVFCIPQKKLLGYTGKWAAGELTEIDSYLLFLALLNSTDLVEFRVPVHRTTETASLVANNMDALFRVIGRINIIKHPHFTLPQFVVSQDTKTLENVHYWIDSWNSCYQEFCNGYREAALAEKLKRREQALERLLRQYQNKPERFATILADWAEQAGAFPSYISSYWKQLIAACVKEERIFSYPRVDLDELIEHCEEHIPHGSIYAFTLMDLLRNGAAKQRNFLGLGDIDLSSATPFRILDSNTNVEDANIQAQIDAAPATEPKEREYPSKIAYLRAKARWELAQKYRNKDTEGNTAQEQGQ